ncbi:tRNA pseudouridine(55) synthase TruB [Sphingomonas crusticola]|uniref:tRNA pseudouridine(55) synthase TruB n=1 Tax=Sphingomonas crusticola TaxID=1697973 RepID=UPI000E242FA5|nr:tRNA pseudouridine(55) synthase TruB [Sphingomonas crusticola]
MTGAPLHGWIILDKPVGLGSTQAVSAVKRALRTGGHGKAKVGHGGTLDPLASGVLPIAIGEATKLSGRMLDADKAYDFTIRFGEETDTLDAEGAVIGRSDVRPTLAEVEAVLTRFTGPISQIPPAYSALKVDGKRAYDLARAGETVELASRNVTIHALTVRQPGLVPRSSEPRASAQAVEWMPEQARHDGLHHDITLSARVSKGTYIRSLARDIAYALGTVGHVTMLRRTKAGPFALESAISLDILDQAAKDARLQELLLPLTAGLDDIPVLAVSPDQAQALRQGRRLIGHAAPPGLNLAMLGDLPVALVEVGTDISVVRGFNLMSE